MAQSKLAAQLHEATQAARDLNSEAVKFGQIKANYASDMAPGGGNGGGGGTVLVDPSGRPVNPSGAPAGQPTRNPSGGSIVDFLERFNGPTSSSSQGGAGGGGGRIERPPSPDEKAIMQSLGEPIEYVRKLVRAAGWAGLPLPYVLRAPKAERDALVAAYEEHGLASGKSEGGGGSSGGGSGSSRTTAWDEQNNTAFTSGATNNQPNEGKATAKATVDALGSVVNELKTLNKTVARKDPGMSFRTGEI